MFEAGVNGDIITASIWNEMVTLNMISGGYVTRSGTNLLFAPDEGKFVRVYESSTWVPKAIPDAGITVACTGLTVDTDYYLYVYDLSDVLTLDLSVTAPTTQNGIYVKTAATSRTLIARCRANASGAITTYADDASTQLVCNLYNKRSISLYKTEATNTWTYQSATIRSLNNSTANRVQFVSDGRGAVQGKVVIVGVNSASGDNPVVGIDLDGTTANDAQLFTSGGAAGTPWQCEAVYLSTPAAGFHYLQAVEFCNGVVAAVTFRGDNGGTALQGGIFAMVMA